MSEWSCTDDRPDNNGWWVSIFPNDEDDADFEDIPDEEEFGAVDSPDTANF